MAAAKFNVAYDSLEQRAALPARREPYWNPVNACEGLHLGFRKMPETGTETWIARASDEATASGYRLQSLGRQKDIRAATKAAMAWFADRQEGFDTATNMTVRQLCADYCDAMERGAKLQEKVKAEARPKAAAAMRKQHARWINNDPIAYIKVAKLKASDSKAWLLRLKAAAPDLKDTSVNRELLCLRAPLNYALDMLKIVKGNGAWKVELAKIADADQPRELYLDATERQLLISKAAPDMQQLMKLMLAMPVRPGAAAALTVGSFEKRLHTIRVTDDKGHADRTFGIPQATAAFVAELCADKLPGAPLLMRANGSPWNTREWGREFAKARDSAFPEGDVKRTACAYTLRHCAITDMVKANVPIAVVAHIAGTSVAEIERTYLKHKPQDGASALDALAVAVNF